MGTLDKITSLLNTHLAKEASTTAKVLLRDSMKKKRQEVALLEAADTGEVIGTAVENFDIDWDALLDPWSMSQFATQGFSMMSGDTRGGFVTTM
jgi:hypothetical protein